MIFKNSGCNHVMIPILCSLYDEMALDTGEQRGLTWTPVCFFGIEVLKYKLLEAWKA